MREEDRIEEDSRSRSNIGGVVVPACGGYSGSNDVATKLFRATRLLVCSCYPRPITTDLEQLTIAYHVGGKCGGNVKRDVFSSCTRRMKRKNRKLMKGGSRM